MSCLSSADAPPVHCAPLWVPEKWRPVPTPGQDGPTAKAKPVGVQPAGVDHRAPV